VPGREIKVQPEGVMAHVCLGVTVIGLYTLVGMGFAFPFARKVLKFTFAHLRGTNPRAPLRLPPRISLPLGP
jgi:hypothetical protein